jgi:hypothetical protein
MLPRQTQYNTTRHRISQPQSYGHGRTYVLFTCTITSSGLYLVPGFGFWLPISLAFLSLVTMDSHEITQSYFLSQHFDTLQPNKHSSLITTIFFMSHLVTFSVCHLCHESCSFLPFTAFDKPVLLGGFGGESGDGKLKKTEQIFYACVRFSFEWVYILHC